MNEARRTHDWDQSSLVWSAIANTVRDPQKQRKPFSPGLVHPFRTAADYEQKPQQVGIDALKVLLNQNERPVYGSGSD
jgi:hypothetical protein